jgi:chromate transporter
MKPMETAVNCELAPDRRSLWELTRVFLKVGATGFGGAMAMLAMIHAQVVEKRHWITQEEFDEAVAIGQILPGPIAVNAVAYMGYRQRGVAGAIVSAGAFILPASVLMLVLSALYLSFGGIPQVSSVFRGLGAAVVAVILSSAYRMGKPHLKDPRTAALMGLALAALLLQVNVILLVVLAGAAGMVLFRKPSDFPAPQKRGGKA